MCEEGGWIGAGWGEEDENEEEEEDGEEEVVRLMPRGSEFGLLCLLGATNAESSIQLIHASGQFVHFPVVYSQNHLFFCSPSVCFFLLLASAYIRASERLFLFGCVFSSCVAPTVAKKSERFFFQSTFLLHFVHWWCGITAVTVKSQLDKALS